MATTYANINPNMLTWARERAQLSMDALAQNFKRLADWESGEKRPTFNQAQQFANKVHVPFGYLFLEKPPQEEFPLPDLRTVGGEQPAQPSVDLREIVDLMSQRQDWYREYLLEQEHEPLAFISRFDLRASPEEITEDIRRELGVDGIPDRVGWEEYYRDLVRRIEALGVMVMRQSYLGSWHRTLKVSEFRGFAMVDELAPLIFVNHADYPGPRLFTLIHELCHVWLGRSGVSDVSPGNENQIEVLCNAVAGEFLVPAEEFIELWAHQAETWEDNLPGLSAHFHVSQIVIARRALTMRIISREQYRAFDRKQKEAWANRERGTSPSYYRTESARISKSFSSALISETMSGRVLLRDAGQILGMKPGNIVKYAKELGI